MTARELSPCGTNAAYQRHVSAGGEPDQACHDAHAAYLREWRRGRAPAAVRKAALEQLAAEYPVRFRQICGALVAGDAS